MNRAYAALLLAALCWGLALTSADAALAGLSATDLLFLETLSGTVVVIGACLVTGRPIGGAWRPAVALGALEPGIAYVFANVGLILTSAAVGSMLFALESVFVVAIAAVLLRVRPRRVEIGALVLGVLGTVAVASAQSGGRSSGMGVAIMVVSTLISAGYVLATRTFAGGHEPVALVARQGVASLLVTAPFVLGASLNGGSRLLTAPVECLLLACLTGVIGFAIPYTLWTTSLPHVRPGFAAVALNLVPLIGVISATLLGQGGLGAGQWAGGAAILGGLVLMTIAEMRTTHAETVPDATTRPTTLDQPAPLPLALPLPAIPVVPVQFPGPRVPVERASAEPSAVTPWVAGRGAAQRAASFPGSAARIPRPRRTTEGRPTSSVEEYPAAGHPSPGAPRPGGSHRGPGPRGSISRTSAPDQAHPRRRAGTPLVPGPGGRPTRVPGQRPGPVLPGPRPGVPTPRPAGELPTWSNRRSPAR